MATPDPVPLPQPMPDDLKARGWKMARVDGGRFKARNDNLGLYSNPMDSPEEAIAAARHLDQGGTASFDGRQTTFGPVDEEGSPPETIRLNSETVQVDSGTIEAIGETKEDFNGTIQPPAEPVEEVRRETLPPATNSLVPVAKIRLDGGTQPREEIDQSVVDRYAEDYQNNAVFPLIVIFHDGIYHWLADGFHRYFAFRKAFPDSGFITADVRTGTQRDAVLYSLGANATHGLPRSNADKRRAVLTLLQDPEWSKWSDNAIAQKASVSQPFVSSVRRELTQNVLSAFDEAYGVTEGESWEETQERIRETAESIATRDQVQPAKRIGTDGIARDTSNIGRKPESQERESVKVVDKRRVTADAPSRTSFETLLKGRKLAVSFVYIPGLTGKVHVSVNAGDRPDQASRQLIAVDEMPRFPEPVLALITEQLTAPAPKPANKPAKGKTKARGRSTPVTKKPVTKKPVSKKAPAKKKVVRPAKTTKTARKK